jgi:hypothetical protein
LLTHPNFYSTIEGNGGAIIELKGMVNTTFVSEVFDQSSNINSGLSSNPLDRSSFLLEAKLNFTSHTINQTKAKNEVLEKTLSKIDSPFGPILNNLNESTLIFPLLLAIGSLINSSFAASAIKIRNNVYNYYNTKFWNNDLEKSKDIFIIAPLWIDPLQAYANQMIKYIILFILLIIFFVSCFFIGIEWSILNNLKESDVDWIFPGDQYFTQRIFLILYTLSLGLFIYGYTKIILELNRHEKLDSKELKT